MRCETRIWHPNINEDGEVCLSLLRQNSLDALGKEGGGGTGERVEGEEGEREKESRVRVGGGGMELPPMFSVN